MERTELEIAYSLLPDSRNKGFETEAAIKCKEYAFRKNYSDPLISIINLTNTPSANVAIKNGMRAEKQTIKIRYIFSEYIKMIGNNQSRTGFES